MTRRETGPGNGRPAVLNIGNSYHVRAGADRYMLELEALLQSRGHTVVPFAPASERNRDTPWSRFFPPGVDVEHPGPRDALRFVYSLPARRAIGRLLDTWQPDLAHLHIYYGQLTTSILAPLRERGIPVIQSLHEYKLACPVYTFVSNGQICEACKPRRFWHAVPKRCNRGSLARTLLSVTESYLSRVSGAARDVDHFIAVSDFLRGRMIEHGVASSDRISTLHNFVDCDRVEPAAGPGRHILYFGRLAPVKGLAELVEAASGLADIPLLIAGDGPLRPALERRIAELGLDHVRLVGFRSGSDLQALIRDSLCTVLPSRWYENCPLSVLESLAAGRPVVASRIGGVPELIDHEADGFLVAPGDVQGLRERLSWMAGHPAAALEMGRVGRQKMRERFSPATHYRTLSDIYERVLGGRPR